MITIKVIKIARSVFIFLIFFEESKLSITINFKIEILCHTTNSIKDKIALLSFLIVQMF